MKNKKIIDISDNRTLLSKFSYLYAKINRLMNFHVFTVAFPVHSIYRKYAP